MIHFQGYVLKHEQTVISSSAQLFLATDKHQNELLLTRYKKDGDSQGLIKFKKSLELQQQLAIDGIIKPSSINENQFYYFATFPLEAGQKSLLKYCNNDHLDINTKLLIALDACRLIYQLHKQQFILNGLNPATFFVNTNHKVSLVDFSHVTKISTIRKRSNTHHLSAQYFMTMSPEASGRINVAVEQSSDLYAFGTLLYKLFCGRFPFEYDDELEMVHAHIAKKPEIATTFCPKLPEQVSLIIAKLLNKNAEDRYHTAKGLLTDIQLCIEQYNKTNQIELFTLAQFDHSDRLNFSTKLYGREKEISSLLTIYQQVEMNRQSHLCFIKGYSGVGKSRLVAEIYKPNYSKSIEQQGYLISGKFEQYKKNSAYFALTQALTELIEQMLGESEKQLLEWQDIFNKALGDYGQLLVDFIPEFGLILGDQKEIIDLPTEQETTRFNLMLVSFFKALGQKKQVFSIFLDDMQWADLATIDLIQQLINDEEINQLLFILSYRDNEVDEIHPLNNLLSNENVNDNKQTTIQILPLSHDAIHDFISNLLNKNKEKVIPFTKLVIEKTAGNPFFVIEFIKSLIEKNLLYKNEHNEWDWQLAKLNTLTITDNVVDLMTQRLARLSLLSRDILHCAACIGNTIEVDLLTSVLQIKYEVLEEELRAIVADGYVLAFSSHRNDELITELKFSHDKIQQAAYQLASSTSVDLIHYRIACHYLTLHYQTSSSQTMAKNTNESMVDSKNVIVTESLNEVGGCVEKISVNSKYEGVFDYIEHMNASSHCFIEVLQQPLLVECNQIAGQKALEANAYLNSLHYFNMAERFLNEDHWSSQYQISFSIGLSKTMVFYLTQEYHKVNDFFLQLTEQANNVIDLAKIYKIQILSLIAQNDMQAAFALGNNILHEMNIDLPPAETIAEIYLTITEYYQETEIENLNELPQLKNEIHILAVDILNTIQTPAYLIAPVEYMKVIFTSLKLCFKYGVGVYSGNAFVSHALLLCGVYSEFTQGLKFAHLASSLNDKYPSDFQKTLITFSVNVSVNHWNEHINKSLVPLKQNFYLGLECGNIEYAFHSILFYCFHNLLSGVPLDKVNAEFNKYIKLMADKKQFYQLILTQVWHQYTLNLIEDLDDPTQLQGESFNETLMLPVLTDTNNITTLFVYHSVKMSLAYRFGKLKMATQQLELAEKYSNSVASLYHFGDFYFNAALVHCAVCRENKALKSAKPYKKSLKKLKEILSLLEQWAVNSPENQQHKCLIIKAEMEAFNDESAAWKNYDLAINCADKNQFIQHKALFCELAGNYWLSENKAILAAQYFHQAYAFYIEWGANAKAKQLMRMHHDLLASIQNIEKLPIAINGNILKAKIKNKAPIFDLVSVLKASEALSGEVDLQEFLHRMLIIIIENAGAQKGALLFQKGGELKLELAIVNEHVFNGSIPLPYSIINYVSRIEKALILTHHYDGHQFSNDPYFIDCKPKSIMCVPSIVKGKLQGIVYLEHDDIPDAFSDERVNIIQLLAEQTAISFDNASLYTQLVDYNKNLEDTIHQRTKELATEKIKAEQANKAKSNFLANMSHEIRTPMNAVIGLSQLALRTELNTIQQDYLEKIQDSSKSLLGLINDILDFSKIEAQKMTLENIKFSLTEILQRVVNVCTYKVHEKGLEFVIDIAPDVPKTLIGDPLRLQQIIINLANNAIKFTESGAIHISIDKQAINDLFKDKENKDRKMIQLQFSVEDSGIGLNASQQKSLFKSFSQADDSVTRKYGGSGLGLAISKQLAELMGGKIWVVSQTGLGSTFSFTANFEQADPERETMSVVRQNSFENLRVLVADDSDIARKVLIETLDYMDIKAEGVANGELALEYVLRAEQQEKPYDLVLMDWKMPKMDGIEAAKQIKKQAKGKLPHILMVSAYDKDQAKLLAEHTNIEQFLEKPINQTMLTKSIASFSHNKARLKGERLQVEDSQYDSVIPDLSAFKILLAEDNILNQQVAKAFLTDTQINIVCVENGIMALEKLANQEFDLVLMDIQMPEMDGLTAAQEIRNTLKLKDLPIIAMTAHAMEGDIEKSIEAGMNQHLTKPIAAELLYQTLATYLLNKRDEKVGESNKIEPFIAVDSSAKNLRDKNNELDICEQLTKLRKNTSLDIDEAIIKLQGKKSLYLELVQNFWENNQQLPIELGSLKKQKSNTVLYRNIHTLKSTAQYIGDFKLSLLAQSFENIPPHEHEVLDLKFNEIITQLEFLMVQLNTVYTKAKEVQPTKIFDVDLALPLIVNLQPLLHLGDIQAEEDCQKLYHLGEHTKYFDLIKVIHQKINNFDFEEALTDLNTLEQAIIEK